MKKKSNQIYNNIKKNTQSINKIIGVTKEYISYQCLNIQQQFSTSVSPQFLKKVMGDMMKNLKLGTTLGI